jgi:hypothetical protein
MHIGASAICPHGGQISSITTNTRVLVNRRPVVTQTDTFTIIGCTFPPSGTPHPCVMSKWHIPATRILVSGKPAILQDSQGMCYSADQSPQGPPIVISTQIRARGV